MSSDCYFKFNRLAIGESIPRDASTDLSAVECEGECVLVADSYSGLKRNICLHGFSSVSELLFFRANAELPTEDEMEDRRICKSHLRFLLIDWPAKSKKQLIVKKRKGLDVIRCVLPHAEEPPAENHKASKKNVLWWLEHKNQLIHIGASVCSTHTGMMLGDGKVKVLGPIQTRAQPRKEAADEEWKETSETGGIDEWDDVIMDDVENDTDASNQRETLRHHFSEISKLLSTTHFSSDIDWDRMAADTQRRKVALGCRIVEAMCESMVGDGSEEFMSAIVQKMSKRRGDEDCADQILNAVGERLANANTRRSRVEALSILVDVPYFSSYKVLLSIPGVTRYLIHQSRLYARGGLDLDAKFTRERFNRPAVSFLMSFLVRANVLVSLSWITNTATKSDGTKVDLASTIRTQAYARIIRLYMEELKVEKKTKEESLSTGTVYAILKKVVPKMSQRKTCVDEFACTANEGPCDRTTSHAKRKINEHTNGLKNTRDAAEVFTALTGAEPIRGTSSYHCSIDSSEDSDVKKIPDISTIFDVRFEESKVITRKHSGIGQGVENVDLNPLMSKMTVNSEGGFLSDEHFWASYGQPKSVSTTPSVTVPSNPDDQLLAHKTVFYCSTPGCVKVFTLLRNLEAHEKEDMHTIREKKGTLLDFAVDEFSGHVENEEAARLCLANDSFRNISIVDGDHELKEGYALKKIKHNTIAEKSKAAAEEFFLKHRSMVPPRRACPRTFSQSMIHMKEGDGQYTFKVSELLSEKQVQGLFSRMEKKRTSGVRVVKGAKAKKGQSATTVPSEKKNRKRKHSEEEEANAKKANYSYIIFKHQVQPVAAAKDDADEEESEEEEDEFDFLMEAVMEDKEELFQTG